MSLPPKKHKSKTPKKRKYVEESELDIDGLKPLPKNSGKKDTEAYVSAIEKRLSSLPSKKTLKHEELQKREASYVVHMIMGIFEQDQDKAFLTQEEREKFDEFVKYIKDIDIEDIPGGKINEMKHYILLINRNKELYEQYFNESKNQTINEANDLINFINYTLKKKIKALSEQQKKQLGGYLNYIQNVVTVKKITENEVISIQNHIRSAIYKKKKEIMKKINDMMLLYSNNNKKLKILTELKDELGLLADKFLSKADSDYFTEQLKLLQTGKYIIRENLLELIDDEILRINIGTLPDSYIDKVNKLKTKIRRKPFILPHKYKDKIMNKLKQITRVNKFYIF